MQHFACLGPTDPRDCFNQAFEEWRMDSDLIAQAQTLLVVCRTRQIKIATAESCTGGLLAATLTEIPGSSDVFDRGFVTYSNASKQVMIGVPKAVLDGHGAVSKVTAEAMALGALAN